MLGLALCAPTSPTPPTNIHTATSINNTTTKRAAESHQVLLEFRRSQRGVTSMEETASASRVASSIIGSLFRNRCTDGCGQHAPGHRLFQVRRHAEEHRGVA